MGEKSKALFIGLAPNAQLEPSVIEADTETRFQFERVGYFCFDSVDHRPDKVVMNRTVSLRDAWAKVVS